MNEERADQILEEWRRLADSARRPPHAPQRESYGLVSPAGLLIASGVVLVLGLVFLRSYGAQLGSATGTPAVLASAPASPPLGRVALPDHSPCAPPTGTVPCTDAGHGIDGTLRQAAGCLWMTIQGSGQDVRIVWPMGFSASSDLQIIFDGTGKEIARAGDLLYAGGSGPYVDEAPDACGRTGYVILIDVRRAAGP